MVTAGLVHHNFVVIIYTKRNEFEMRHLFRPWDCLEQVPFWDTFADVKMCIASSDYIESNFCMIFIINVKFPFV